MDHAGRTDEARGFEGVLAQASAGIQKNVARFEVQGVKNDVRILHAVTRRMATFAGGRIAMLARWHGFLLPERQRSQPAASLHLKAVPERHMDIRVGLVLAEHGVVALSEKDVGADLLLDVVGPFVEDFRTQVGVMVAW